MNGMRKISQINKKSAKQVEDHEEDELDFEQQIEETVEKAEENPVEEEKVVSKGKLMIEEFMSNGKMGNGLVDRGMMADLMNSEVKPNILYNSKNLSNPLTNHASVPTIENISSEMRNLPLNLSDEILLNLKTPTDMELLDAELSDSVSRESADTETERSVYVKNLDFNTVPEDLEAHFKGCGQISRITILVDKYTGLPKGYAFVEFVNMEGKEKAKELNDSFIKGRQIKIEEKRKNLPHYFGKKTKYYNRPVYTSDSLTKGNKAYFGPMKGKITNNRHFQPY